MKLLCSALLVNRAAPNAKTKSANSTIALCKQPGTNEFCIILFTARNQQGTRYNLKNNIEKVFARYVNEGKSTIQFKQPPHDICIQANSIQLKCFLRLLKMAVENQVKDEDLAHYSGVSVTPVAKKDIPIKQLWITSKLAYPSQGFPKSLEMLRMNNLELGVVTPGILNLRFLKVLDMSNNSITFLPEALNKLRLQELYMSDNLLGSSSPGQWAWMGGQLSYTLKVLDLCLNRLKYLPKQIGKLYSLHTLRVNHNELVTLPTGIGQLTSLKTLAAGNNSISVLPGSIKMLRLNELDLSCNTLPPISEYVGSDKPKPILLHPFSLKECAAKKVLRSRIPYTPLDLPRTVIQYLDDAEYCVCGEACFENVIKNRQCFSLKDITVTITMTSPQYVPVDCHYCSPACYSINPLAMFVIIR